MPADPAVAERLDDHLIAGTEVRDTGTDLGDDAARLVAYDAWKRDIAPDSLDGLVVSGAEATGLDPDQRLIRRAAG